MTPTTVNAAPSSAIDAADDRGVPAKPALPECVCQHDDAIAAALFFFGEDAPDARHST